MSSIGYLIAAIGAIVLVPITLILGAMNNDMLGGLLLCFPLLALALVLFNLGERRYLQENTMIKIRSYS